MPVTGGLLMRLFLILFIMVASYIGTPGQADEICGATGAAVPWLNSAFVYGRVNVEAFDRAAKLPKITVILYDRNRAESRMTIDRTGNYCFRDVNANGGYIVIEVEGLEVIRRSLPSGGPPQHRQDFDISPTHRDQPKPPTTISAKFNYQRDAKNSELFDKAVAAEREKEAGKAIGFLKELVASDPKDYPAWAKLGSLYFDRSDHGQAESAFQKAVAARPDFTPAIMNLGRVYLLRNEVDKAIETFRNSTLLEPGNARAFQLLGEAYLIARKGTLGVEALNEAIRLDPIGMAECHLLMARLYDLAGIKPMASREYRLFLEKVPNHADRKKLEKYIKDNPERDAQ